MRILMAGLILLLSIPYAWIAGFDLGRVHATEIGDRQEQAWRACDFKEGLSLGPQARVMRYFAMHGIAPLLRTFDGEDAKAIAATYNAEPPVSNYPADRLLAVHFGTTTYLFFVKADCVYYVIFMRRDKFDRLMKKAIGPKA